MENRKMTNKYNEICDYVLGDFATKGCKNALTIFAMSASLSSCKSFRSVNKVFLEDYI
jgi:hypothetical protein